MKMIANEAKEQLLSMMKDNGVNLEKPSFDAFWKVYKDFITTKIVPGVVDYLFCTECVAPNQDDDRFTISLIVQFSINKPTGEYDHLEQMGCNFCYLSRDMPEGEEDVIWSDDFPDILTYFNEVEHHSNISGLYLLRIDEAIYWSTKI